MGKEKKFSEMGYNELWDELEKYPSENPEHQAVQKAINNFLDSFVEKGDYDGLSNEMYKLYRVNPKPANFGARLDLVSDAMNRALRQEKKPSASEKETPEKSEEESFKEWLGDQDPKVLKKELEGEYDEHKNRRDVLNAEWRARIDPLVAAQHMPYAVMLKRTYKDFLSTEEGKEFIAANGRPHETRVGDTTFVDDSRMVLDSTFDKDIRQRMDIFAISHTLKSLEKYKNDPNGLLKQFFHQAGRLYQSEALLEGSTLDPKLNYNLDKRQKEREQLERRLYQGDEDLQKIGEEIAEEEGEMADINQTLVLLKKHIRQQEAQNKKTLGQQTGDRKVAQEKPKEITEATEKKSFVDKVIGSFTSLVTKQKDNTPGKNGRGF